MSLSWTRMVVNPKKEAEQPQEAAAPAAEPPKDPKAAFREVLEKSKAAYAKRIESCPTCPDCGERHPDEMMFAQRANEVANKLRLVLQQDLEEGGTVYEHVGALVNLLKTAADKGIISFGVGTLGEDFDPSELRHRRPPETVH